MQEIERLKLKRLYSDVSLGRSRAESKHFGKIYIRHVDPYISSELDEMHLFYLEKSKGNLPSLADREIQIFEEESWTEKQEKELENERYFLKSLYFNKKKSFRKQESRTISESIIKSEKKLQELEWQKIQAIGQHQESWALKQMNEYYIFICSYKDPELKEKLFIQKDFDELEKDQIDDLSDLFSQNSQLINTKILKQISVIPSFLNYFYLCEDNPYSFYGKPISQLTFFQVELFGYGRYFKRILSEYGSRIPEDVMEDPEKLVEWYDTTKNLEQTLENTPDKPGMMQSVTGLGKDDLAALRSDPNNRMIDLGKEVAKAGRDLDIKDIIRLQNG